MYVCLSFNLCNLIFYMQVCAHSLDASPSRENPGPRGVKKKGQTAQRMGNSSIVKSERTHEGPHAISVA